ncbi:neuronal acetylcholine receptor subunit alpha-10-like [Branchiostoma floridae x Branchiostoma belcheri]
MGYPEPCLRMVLDEAYFCRLTRSDLMMKMYIVTLCFAVFLPNGVSGDFEARKLKRHLLTDYETGLRPVRHVTTQTTVQIGIDFRQIIDIDEKNQVMSSAVWLRQYWTDEALQWNSSDFWNISSINIPSKEVWLPDTVLYNSVGSDHNQLMTNVGINSAGYMTWMAPRIFASSCKIDIYYFPFDEQECTLEFGSWTYGGFDVNTTTEDAPPSLTYFVYNDEWELINITGVQEDIYYPCCPEPYPLVTFTIHVQRRSMYYLIFLVSPCLLFSIMTILGFYLPPEAGERVGLGITVLLSFTVFLLMVSDLMPPTSSAVPLIVCYYGITIIMVMLALSMTVLVLKVHYTDPDSKPVPPWVRRLLLSGIGRVFCTPSGPEKPPPSIEPSLSHCSQLEILCEDLELELYRNGKIRKETTKTPSSQSELPIRQATLLRALRTLTREIQHHVISCHQQRWTNEETENEWKRVGKVLDKFCVTLFTAATVLTAIGMALKVPKMNLQ